MMKSFNLPSNPLLVFILVVWCSSLSLSAQQIITIKTKSNDLVFQVDSNKDVHMLYFGKKLKDSTEYRDLNLQYNQGDDYTGIYNSIYTTAGSKNLLEPALSITHANGDNSSRLEYIKHESTIPEKGISLTQIYLRDPVYHTEITLFFKAYYQEDLIEQWTEITNREKGEITLQKYASANLYLRNHSDAYWLHHYHGDWATEMKPEEEQLTHGIKVLDSKLGTRANLFQPPVFMISIKEPATEEKGEVLLAGLEWSGNFRFDLEMDPLNNLRIISGINNYASHYTLSKDQKLTTPKFWYTLSHQGKGKASRNIHDWARKYKILNGEGSRLTLLNNWEATYFDFNEAKLKSLISGAGDLGVDLFLLDDGWFGNKYPRNDDHAGLGDWEINKKKLPNGIGTLIKTATEEGIRFGIWLEPEMVNPKSELFEKHPEWAIRQPQRPEHYFRNQLVLDLTNPEVQDFLYHTLIQLFTKNPDLSYIKWDCNAVIYNAYSDFLKNRQSQLYVDYVEGLYTVLERFREQYPEVPMMLCSGGGGRIDYGALAYFTEFWPSDNTDPLERIFMQWEYSYFYPSKTMGSHVTNWGKQSLKYKTDVAMTGKLGFDIDLGDLSAQELQFAKNALALYKTVEPTILDGDLFRLQDPWQHDASSLVFVNKKQTEAVLFTFLLKNRYGAGTASPILLQGLNPDKTYKVEEVNVFPGKSTAIESSTYSGDFLMKVGLNPIVNDGHKSSVIKITALK